MNPRELIRASAVRFRNAGIPDPETDASLLLSHLTGKPPLMLRLDTDTQLSPEMIRTYKVLSSKRLSRIPLQYLLEEAPFCGRMFHVDQSVLIPRPETELLCRWALDELQNTFSPCVLDLCCGSGCIGLTIKAERNDADVILSDLSETALKTSKDNAERFSLSVSFHLGDLFLGLPETLFDMIVCNPPYIPSGLCDELQAEVRYEPRMALDGGEDGLLLYRKIVSEAVSFLKPGGKLLLELGTGEADAVSDLLYDSGFRKQVIRNDIAGIQRMILAVRP